MLGLENMLEMGGDRVGRDAEDIGNDPATGRNMRRANRVRMALQGLRGPDVRRQAA
jgi:hypothetical protein